MRGGRLACSAGRVKRTGSQKREKMRDERTGRNKTVISRHFTHERERLADSTCVPALCRFPAAMKCPSLFPPFLIALSFSPFLSFSLSVFLFCVFCLSFIQLLSPLFTLFSLALSPTPSHRVSLKNTALADTCSFDVLHMCARSTSSCRRARRVEEETRDDEIDSRPPVKNWHKVC